MRKATAASRNAAWPRGDTVDVIEFNGRPWPASVEEIASGLFVKAAGTFDLPAGYQVTMTRGLRSWELIVAKCLRCPAGENETWIWFTVASGPVNAVPRKRRR
ncbi:hypothetical protein BH11PLA2_BH11PLA2_47200 [soil metagenome]